MDSEFVARLTSIEDMLTQLIRTSATKASLAELRGEMQAMGAELREDMQAMGAGLRGEMQAMGVELRGEMQAMGVELRGEIQAMGVELRGEMQAMGAELRGEMQVQNANIYEVLGKLTDEVKSTNVECHSTNGLISQLERKTTVGLREIGKTYLDLQIRVGLIEEQLIEPAKTT